MTDTTTAATFREQLEQRLDALRDAPGYHAYLQARDQVLAMKDSTARAPGGKDTSHYWEEELGTLAFMFDAGPVIVSELRHHTYTVTGIRAYDYRTMKDAAVPRFSRKLEALRELGSPDLLVPESPLLGGFGHEIDGALYNIDTLKYFEVLTGMDRAGALAPFRAGHERAVALEIGSGWGGFPYVFKTRFPNTTYCMVDLPELFLYSATYLRTAFPDARIHFMVDDEIPEPDEWLTYDFVLIPNTRLHQLRPPRLDLALNMVSFQEMTAGQVADYVAKAHELGAPFMYSLNRERSYYNDELESVTAIIDRWFWPHEIPLLPVNYMKMLPDDGKAAKAKKGRPKDEMEYKHVAGQRRVLT
jgi:hypothetical protein